MLPSPTVTDETASPSLSLLRLAGGFYAIVALFAAGYAIFDWIRMASPVPGDYVFLGIALPSLGLAVAGIGVGAILVAVVHVGMRTVPGVDRAAQELASLLGPITPREAIWLAVFSGFAEELLFRGALWSHLGLFGTTLLFGLVHIVPRRALWGYPLFAAGAGLLFGILRDASGSVLPAMFAHMTVNGLNLWWLARQHAAPAAPPAASLSDPTATAASAPGSEAPDA